MKKNRFLFVWSIILVLVMMMINGQAFAIVKKRPNILLVVTDDMGWTGVALTSSFAKSIRARICMMAINFRNRIQSLVDQDAGNYGVGSLI